GSTRRGGTVPRPTPDETVVPFMNQIAASPLVSFHRMSLMPSPLKSPVSTTDQVVASEPSPALDKIAEPFISQTALLRERFVAGSFNHPTPPTSVGVGALDGPDARRHGGDVRGGGVQDRGAVHLPDRRVAGRVVPENVAHAGAVEVAGFDDRPGGRHGGDVRGGGVQDRGAVHLPDRHVAGRVAPENVGIAVAVEVAGADDRPSAGRHGADVRGGGIQDRGAVHQPDRHVAGRVAPQNVAHAVAVEVAGADDRPGGRHGGDVRGGGVQDRGAVHLPDRHVAGRIVPKQVGIAVAVEVVLPDDRPGAGRYRGDVRGGGVQDRGSIHQPDRRVAGRIAPGDVALAVAVEVVGIGRVAPHEDPRRAGPCVVGAPAHHNSVTVTGQRNGKALPGRSNRASADQLRSPLGPDAAALGKDPRGSDARVVAIATHDGGVAVGRQHDGVTLIGGSADNAAADQLGSLLGPDPAALGEHPRRSNTGVLVLVDWIVVPPAHDGGGAVGGQRNGLTFVGRSNSAAADQLGSLLGPDTAALGEHPRRPDATVVGKSAHNGGVAIDGQRHGVALVGASNTAGADQLGSLLGPDTAAVGEDPRRADIRAVAIPSHDGGVAVGGQRDGGALYRFPDRAGADQLGSLLGPDTAAASKDPRRPHRAAVAVVVVIPAHDRGVTVGGQRNGRALVGGSNRAGADQLRSLLGELCRRWLRGANERAENQDGRDSLGNSPAPVWPRCGCASPTHTRWVR